MFRKLSVVLAVLVITACTGREKTGGLMITATIFPLYDFARIICGERGTVNLLIPPGVEIHSFELKPRDMAGIYGSDLFICLGDALEPWVPAVIKAGTGGKPVIFRADEGVLMKYLRAGGHKSEEKYPDHAGMNDPHIWLDFEIDTVIVSRLAMALAGVDPVNTAYYRSRAEILRSELVRLDKEYRDALARCRIKTIIYGGHFAFGYMAARYGLGYVSPYRGFSTDAEPSPGNISELVRLIRQSGARYLFFEELLEPKVARIIRDETGAGMLLLHGAHNITKGEMESGVSFISIMKNNLENLKLGLDYRK